MTRWSEEGWGREDPRAPARRLAWGIAISVCLWLLVLVPLVWFTGWWRAL